MEEKKQEEIGGKQEKGSEKKGQHVNQPEQMEIERNEDEQNQCQENPLLQLGCTASASFLYILMPGGKPICRIVRKGENVTIS
jgi:hypothetical protein